MSTTQPSDPQIKRVDTSTVPPKPPPSPKRARATGRLTGWFMLTPALTLLFIFLVVPFLMAFGLALTNQRLISPEPTEFIGLDNYRRLISFDVLTLEPETDPDGEPLTEDGQLVYPEVRDFTRSDEFPQYEGLAEWLSFGLGDTKYVLLAADTVFMRSLVNTLIFTMVIVPVQGGLGLALALLVNKRTRGVNVFRTIYFVPVVMSMVVVSVLWFIILDPNNGLLNQTLATITLGLFDPIDWLGDTKTALLSIVILSVWQGVGFNMMIWLTGLQTIPPVLYEAADIDGANRWQAFRHVTWPGLRNTMVFVLITITIAAFGLFTQVDVMTQGGPLDTTSTVIYQAVRSGFRQQDIAYGSAISVVFFFMVLAVAMVQRYLTREK